MACRCDDIDMCREDKRILGMCRYMAISIENQDEKIQEQLEKLRKDSPNGYTTENMEDICSDIDDLNEDLGPAARDLLEAITEKEKEVQEILEHALEEDRAYHAQQEEGAENTDSGG